MRKVALVFVLAVFVPSLVLAWLAVRSLRDQQFLIERQQSLLYQGVADAVASSVQETLAAEQRAFTLKVASLCGKGGMSRNASQTFDDFLRKEWPLAQVGFVVNTKGEILSPSPYGRAEARKFYGDNSRFLANRESAEVYASSKLNAGNTYLNNAAFGGNATIPNIGQEQVLLNAPANKSSQPPQDGLAQQQVPIQQRAAIGQNEVQSSWQADNKQVVRNYRSVSPQQRVTSKASLDAVQSLNAPAVQPNAPEAQAAPVPQAAADADQNRSKIAVSEAEFRQLIGEDSDGTMARFVDNKLNVLFWCRPPCDPDLVFGTQISLLKLLEELRPLILQSESGLQSEICVALLDDNARPVAKSHSDFNAMWKRPFVATEVGEALPHWEVAVYLLDPAKLTQSARTLKLTLGLLIVVLLLAIGVGSWLIVSDLNRQLTLARQKTDFVSNVSHELKTPLTSIRMFSELLAEGRVTDQAKAKSYLGIISAEAARLTRLINNVLDFARLERGEKKYAMTRFDLTPAVREAAESFRPHLEANGFQFECELRDEAIWVKGDRDALAQVIVNLLSNAEKYTDGKKEITLRVTTAHHPLPYTEVQVLDRGLGVPKGCEERIFEKFYRAHDSLSNGIQGSGLGLTLARQIARAHGGDVTYEPRADGGSCFSLRLPLAPEIPQSEIQNPSA